MTGLMKYLLPLSLIGCSGSSEEAETVDLPVTTAGGAMETATTDLGYTIELSRVRIAVSQIQFTIEGELHEKPGGALPHPGHYAGGEVTGELPGDFVLEWNGAAQDDLGTATLITGDYRGANFLFRAAAAADGLDAADPMIGHAFHLTGTVSKDGITNDLDILIDTELDTAIVGAVFDDVIGSSTDQRLDIRFFPVDPYEAETAFDGVDFATLPLVGNTVEVRPGTPEHNIIRRTVTTHDHYGVNPE